MIKRMVTTFKMSICVATDLGHVHILISVFIVNSQVSEIVEPSYLDPTWPGTVIQKSLKQKIGYMYYSF